MAKVTVADRQEQGAAYDSIVAALRHLAAACDGAVTVDMVGFNGFDTHFGKELAERSYTGQLTAKQVTAARKMLHKYSGQLAGAGITLPDVAEVESWVVGKEKAQAAAAVQAGTKVTLEGDTLVVAFEYDKAKVVAVKALPERRFDWERKAWLVPARYKGQLLQALPDAQLDDAAKAVGHGKAQERAARAAVRLGTENGYVTVRFDYSPQRVEAVKSLPERKYRASDRTWLVPNRLVAEVVALYPEADHSIGLQALLAKQEELRALSSEANSSFAIPGIKGEPMPFQRAGVEFITRAGGRGIIADEMGLGKTLQALAYLQLKPELRPALVVVPASLKLNWQREIAKWMTTKERVVVLQGTKATAAHLRGATIVVVNYDILRAWATHLRKIKPQVLIADEAHYCKNTKAQRTKLVQQLAGEIDRVILLTGTPVTNRPKELWPLLNMVDPAAWPKFWPFAQRYCDARHNGFGWDLDGASNLQELHEKTRPYMVRRTKEQVLTELPPKRRAVVPMEITGKARKEYDRLMREAIAAMRAASHVGAEHLTYIEKAKQAAVRGKLPAAMDWIADFLDTGEKLVVFATHTHTVDVLMERFGAAAVRVTGADNAQARDAAVQAFMVDDTVRLFVGNIKAAGVGLTLTAASNTVFLELAWTPGDHEQAEDRVHRIGQQDSVTAWYLLSDGTIDDDIYELLEAKRQVVDTVTDGKPGELTFGLFGALARRLLEDADDKRAG